MIGLDFETYGSRDLTKVGLHNYINDPLFQPLLAVAWDMDGDASVFDFVSDGYEVTVDRLKKYLSRGMADNIAAHNANFERMVLRRIGIEVPVDRFIDTAVHAAYHGAGRSLEAAAAQLLGRDKYTRGMELIKLFSIPGKYQERAGSLAFDPQIRIDEKDEWEEFVYYCSLDAHLSYELARDFPIPAEEQEFTSITMAMNDTGWPVDMDAVQMMQARYEINVEDVAAKFALITGDDELNLSSTKQMSEWCAERGIKASSFDEEHVDHLHKRLVNRLASPALPNDKRVKYEDVEALLRAKKDMGGSSLKKLEVIARQTGDDGRLHDPYLHFGAQATGRTTGRGVQMQNLPRLHGEGDDMTELVSPHIHWDNHKLSRNLRQVFRASEDGELIVGDFSSVESRGLAWQAEELWKLDAYRKGLDLYKVLATRIYGVDYDDVAKDQRQIGKTGELSCGYQAGGGAVYSFAKKMGVPMTEIEAAVLVKDWRDANPATVQYWYDLHDALESAMGAGVGVVDRTWGRVLITRIPAPVSLQKMGIGWSLQIRFVSHGLSFVRYIHGVKQVGRNYLYHKPSERKSGDLWTSEFTDPKTGQKRDFTVYGGKLAGLLTQSLCRELFFYAAKGVTLSLREVDNVRIIGQFHDELVLEWVPGDVSLADAKHILTANMEASQLVGFPLAADIKSAPRYIK